MSAIEARAVTSAAELRETYRAAHLRLMGPPTAKSAPVVPTPKPIIRVPRAPRLPPAWLADLIDHNEMLRTLYATGQERRVRRVQRVLDAVAAHFELTVADLIGASRHHSTARHIAMLICRNRLGLTYLAIGAIFAGRDHSTVVHAVRALTARSTDSPALAREIRTLTTASAA